MKTVVRKKQIRNCVVTIHYTGEAYDALPSWGDFSYMKRAMGQLECGNTTGKFHWQCFLEFKYPKRVVDIIKDFPGMHIDVNLQGAHVVAGRRYVHKNDTCVDPRYRFDWPTNPGNGAFYLERRKLGKQAQKIARTIVWDPESDIREQKSKIIDLLQAQLKCIQHELKV